MFLWTASMCREAHCRPQANHCYSTSFDSYSCQTLLTSCWTNSPLLLFTSCGFVELFIIVRLGPTMDCLTAWHRRKPMAFVTLHTFCRPAQDLFVSGLQLKDKLPLPGHGCAGERSHNPSCPSPVAVKWLTQLPTNVFRFKSVTAAKTSF